jgi:ribonuclease-3
MGANASASDLARRLGYHFKRPELFERALTHSSTLANAIANGAGQSYERLEFLGDRVLGLVAADMLIETFPAENEGQLARRHVALVREEALARVAGEIGLGAHLNLARSEEDNGGRNNPAILADACEAVIGALYIDGGLDAAGHFIRTAWRAMLTETPTPPKDAKTALQEWVQGRGLALPQYREVSREGPDHGPVFTVAVTVQGLDPVQGQGASKRAAEQRAAEEMMKKVTNV